jgi:hypothetical protein
MSQRINQSNSPHLVFTRDFHQLLRGRLEPGSTCTISYDPARIIPPGENYVFGDPDRPVVAHLQFVPDGPVTDLPLTSWAGVLEHAPTTVTGEGPMLKGVFTVPDDAQWVMIWFTYVGTNSEVSYDSNNGANTIFRFQHDDIELLEASVTGGDDAPLSYFNCRVEAHETVEAITARYRITNIPVQSEGQEAPLQRTTEGSQGHVIWELKGVAVPLRSVVVFDLLYYIEGRRFKDNNQGHYFIAGEPEKMKLAGM